jgi:hypothetical protein
LVALMRREDNAIEEVERGFIVPNDWRQRAAKVRMVKPVQEQ